MSLYFVIKFLFNLLTYKDSFFSLNKVTLVNKKTKKSVIDCLDNAF